MRFHKARLIYPIVSDGKHAGQTNLPTRTPTINNMSETDKKLSVFVNFPSPYTHSLILAALTSVLPSLSLTFEPPSEHNVPDLQWADYDLLCLDTIQSNPDTQLISSYVYRKTLIRKHMLHAAVQEYLAKQRHRGNQNNVLEKGIPRGWVIDIQFADELDELLMDDLYDLREDLQENENIEDLSERKCVVSCLERLTLGIIFTSYTCRWFVLKPGMSDKGQGIRMFSTEEELYVTAFTDRGWQAAYAFFWPYIVLLLTDRRTAIFESFEPESDEEEEEEEDEDEDEDDNVEKLSLGQDPEEIKKMKELALQDFPDDESIEDPESTSSEKEGEDIGTGVQTSQLRHFVIQVGGSRSLSSTCWYLSQRLMCFFSGICTEAPADRPVGVYEAHRHFPKWAQGDV